MNQRRMSDTVEYNRASSAYPRVSMAT